MIAPSGYGVFLNVPTRDAVLENNILGASGEASVALFMKECPSLGVVTSFRNNLSFAANVLGYDVSVSAPCPQGSLFAGDDAAQAEMVARCTANDGRPCVVSGNLRVDKSCHRDRGCLAMSGCSNASTCGAALFGSDALPDKTSLFAGGWKLAANAPCAITNSSLNLAPQVPKDLFGTSRTTTPSIGAHQFDGTCRP